MKAKHFPTTLLRLLSNVTSDLESETRRRSISLPRFSGCYQMSSLISNHRSKVCRFW
jgi:hypothetical protein